MSRLKPIFPNQGLLICSASYKCRADRIKLLTWEDGSNPRPFTLRTNALLTKLEG